MQTINKLGLIALILAMGAVGYYVINNKKAVEDVKIQGKGKVYTCPQSCYIETDAGKPDKLINCMKNNCGSDACYNFCQDNLPNIDCSQCYS